MGNEKYLNYYIETLTATMTDCVVRNVSMQANAKVTEEIVNEQTKLIDELQNELQVLKENNTTQLEQLQSDRNSVVKQLQDQLKVLTEENVQLKTTSSYFEGDQFYVTYQCSDTPSKRNDLHIVNGTSPTDTYFIITAGAGLSTPVVTSSYFTSSFEGTVLTASTALSYFYGPGYSQTPVVTNGTGSGFKNPLPFTIQQYDQIRFGGNENQVYIIMSSSFSPSNNLYLHLDRTPQGQDLDYFSIRRLVSDPGFIIINNNPIVSQPGLSPSFILPKYMSPTLKKNLPNIIADLSSKLLIP